MYDIRDYIIRQFRPSCMVLSSPKAVALCGENNLSPAELLRPFGNLSKEQLIITPSEKGAYLLKDFQVDFYDGQDYVKMPASTQMKARRQVLENNPPYFDFKDVRQPHHRSLPPSSSKSSNPRSRRGMTVGGGRFWS